MPFFNFQFSIEIEIQKNVIFHSNFKMKIGMKKDIFVHFNFNSKLNIKKRHFFLKIFDFRFSVFILFQNTKLGALSTYQINWNTS